ncbi:MAG: hypothetical protein H5T94_03890 [Pseudothermotoga sp.]|nr:hypothetical protein [Pseudothermotoga sp.]
MFFDPLTSALSLPIAGAVFIPLAFVVAVLENRRKEQEKNREEQQQSKNQKEKEENDESIRRVAPTKTGHIRSYAHSANL